MPWPITGRVIFTVVSESGERLTRQDQLALNVHLRDEATLENFLPLQGMEPLLALLQAQREADGEPAIFLHAGRDSGKTHLLQAACHAVGSGALYLPLAELSSYPADELLQDVESLSLIALDDLHVVCGDPVWEGALFRLFNQAREQDCRLLFAATAAPAHLPVQLRDLQSRLAWAVVFHLPPCDDSGRSAILRFRAARRGLEMGEDVAEYIVNRAPRELSLLLELLERLDRASLVEQRALSIPFVKQVLAW